MIYRIATVALVATLHTANAALPREKLLSTLGRVNDVLDKEVDALNKKLDATDSKPSTSQNARFKDSCDCLLCPQDDDKKNRDGSYDCEVDEGTMVRDVERTDCQWGKLDAPNDYPGRCLGASEMMVSRNSDSTVGDGAIDTNRGVTECSQPTAATCDTCKAMLQAQNEDISNKGGGGCDILSDKMDYLQIWYPKASQDTCDAAMSKDNMEALHNVNKGWASRAAWPDLDATSSEDKLLVNAYDCAMIKCCEDFPKGTYSKRRRSNVAVIIVQVIFISAFLFCCLLLNHSFQTNPNKITNCFKLFSLITTLQLHCSCVAFLIF